MIECYEEERVQETLTEVSPSEEGTDPEVCEDMTCEEIRESIEPSWAKTKGVRKI